MQTFVKQPRGRGAARAEAAGLAWLAEASSAVVKVVNVTDTQLTLERVETSSPTPETARAAGRELARIHNAGAEAFGSPPDGWDGPNYIGRQLQDCVPSDDWVGFYAEQRVLPFARKAKAEGHLTSAGLDTVERCMAALRSVGIEAEPVRLHGDLWSGNLLFGVNGPVFIDPAAHGGHRETDLAMLDLFGAPYLHEIRAGYEEVHPLPQGWLDFTPLHQLHPLAVHAASHGPSYGRGLETAARDVLTLFDV